MWLLKLPIKLIILPIILVLTILVGVLMIVLNIAAVLLNIVSVIFGLGGFAAIFMGQYVNAAVCLVIAFLISPAGLPAIAEWLIAQIDYINYSLKNFVLS